MSADPPALTDYIETSALVAAFLENDAAARQVILASTKIASSCLTLAEADRALTRAKVAGRLQSDDEARFTLALGDFALRCSMVPVSQFVLDRVGHTFPAEPVRTLDAIHLVTAQMLGEPPALVRILTRDRRVRANAMLLGFQVA